MSGVVTQPSPQLLELGWKWLREAPAFRAQILLGLPFYRYQITLMADPSRLRLILKARQTGISTALMAEAAAESLIRPGILTLFVSRNEDLASHLLGIGRRMLEPYTRFLKDNNTELELSNGSVLKSLAQSKDAGRGFPANRVYLDEYAHQQWADDIYTAIGPALAATNGRLTIFSTPRGRRNKFYRLWAGLEGGEWSRHAIPWWKCPTYDKEWHERERPKYTIREWAQEYDCDFIESGLTRFRATDIEAAHDKAAGFKKPIENHRYVTAWDIGRHHDATVGVVWDVTQEPYQLVRYERYQSMPYPRQQALIDERAREYKGRTVIESNGQGDPVYENLTEHVSPFTTTAKTKQQALDSLSLLLEQRSIKFPYIREMEEELLGYEDDDKDLVQDSVMAMAIAAFHAPRQTWVVA